MQRFSALAASIQVATENRALEFGSRIRLRKDLQHPGTPDLQKYESIQCLSGFAFKPLIDLLFHTRNLLLKVGNNIYQLAHIPALHSIRF